MRILQIVISIYAVLSTQPLYGDSGPDFLLKEIELKVESSFKFKDEMVYLRLEIKNVSEEMVFLTPDAVILRGRVPNFLQFIDKSSGSQHNYASYLGSDINLSKNDRSKFVFYPGDSIILKIKVSDWYELLPGVCYSTVFNFSATDEAMNTLFTDHVDLGEVCVP